MINLQKEKNFGKNKIKDSDEESDDVNKCPGGVVILENSPVSESQSNGMVERGLEESWRRPGGF